MVRYLFSSLERVAFIQNQFDKNSNGGQNFNHCLVKISIACLRGCISLFIIFSMDSIMGWEIGCHRARQGIARRVFLSFCLRFSTADALGGFTVTSRGDDEQKDLNSSDVVRSNEEDGFPAGSDRGHTGVGSSGSTGKQTAVKVANQSGGNVVHDRSSIKAASTTLKFDPLGNGFRKKKEGANVGTPATAMEHELKMLMKELLDESPDGTGPMDDEKQFMRETLDALKATGLDEDVDGQNDQGSISSALVDGIMRQLLSKDILYQPMKEIGERYPPWLEANKDSLDPEEYSQYGRQYQYIGKICDIYETDPDNFDALMGLLQDMQECGQPPQEIVDELSPGDASSFAAGFNGLPPLPSGQCVII